MSDVPPPPMFLTEHRLYWTAGWTPWLNNLLGALPVELPFQASCDEATGYKLLKLFGAMEFVGYALLWVMPKFGSFFLTVFMAFALHFHLTFLKDPPAALGLQFALFGGALAVFLLTPGASAEKAKTQ